MTWIWCWRSKSQNEHTHQIPVIWNNRMGFQCSRFFFASETIRASLTVNWKDFEWSSRSDDEKMQLENTTECDNFAMMKIIDRLHSSSFSPTDSIRSHFRCWNVVDKNKSICSKINYTSIYRLYWVVCLFSIYLGRVSGEWRFVVRSWYGWNQ